MSATRVINTISGLVDIIGTPINGNTIVWDESVGKWNFAGLGGDKNLVVDLSPPSSTFTIIHNLGKRPNVRVVDTAGTEIDCCVTDVLGNETNALVITTNGATSGQAILN